MLHVKVWVCVCMWIFCWHQKTKPEQKTNNWSRSVSVSVQFSIVWLFRFVLKLRNIVTSWVFLKQKPNPTNINWLTTECLLSQQIVFNEKPEPFRQAKTRPSQPNKPDQQRKDRVIRKSKECEIENWSLFKYKRLFSTWFRFKYSKIKILCWFTTGFIVYHDAMQCDSVPDGIPCSIERERERWIKSFINDRWYNAGTLQAIVLYISTVVCQTNYNLAGFVVVVMFRIWYHSEDALSIMSLSFFSPVDSSVFTKGQFSSAFKVQVTGWSQSWYHKV